MRFDRLMEQLIGVLALLILIGGTVIVIAPFFTALLWGAILAYCTWHPFQRLANLLGGRRAWATVLVVLLILFVLLGPVFYGGIAFSTRMPDYVVRLQEVLGRGAYPLPGWLSDIPFIGPRIQEAWSGLATHSPELIARLRDMAGPMFRIALSAGASVIQGLGMLVLSILFTAAFYFSGEKAAASLHAVMRHVAGARADSLLDMVGATVKGVVYGILGTSLLQAILCAVAYLIAGLPSPALLGLATFFLAIIPGGPLLVIVPGAIWLTQQGHSGWAAFLVLWAATVSITVDNVLKPLMIGKSSHMPFILIMLGVLGGAAAFGLLGVFVGPTLLAVAYALMNDWTMEVVDESGEEPATISNVSSNVSTGEAR